MGRASGSERGQSATGERPTTPMPSLLTALLPLPCNSVDDDAPYDEIKKAYRALAKSCHPDYLGEKGHEICIMLNEVCALNCIRRFLHSLNLGGRAAPARGSGAWRAPACLRVCTSHASSPDRHAHSAPASWYTQAYQILGDADARANYNNKLEQALLDEDDNYTGARGVPGGGGRACAGVWRPGGSSVCPDLCHYTRI